MFCLENETSDNLATPLLEIIWCFTSDFPSFWKGKMKFVIEKVLKNNFVIFGNIFYFFKVKKELEIFFLYKCKYYISFGNVINGSSGLILNKVRYLIT